MVAFGTLVARFPQPLPLWVLIINVANICMIEKNLTLFDLLHEIVYV